MGAEQRRAARSLEAVLSVRPDWPKKPGTPRRYLDRDSRQANHRQLAHAYREKQGSRQGPDQKQEVQRLGSAVRKDRPRFLWLGRARRQATRKADHRSQLA